tara:strand:- start:2986 stop:3249 length:264 start_codon:yes stop_codon:yes gene_type:complete
MILDAETNGLKPTQALFRCGHCGQPTNSEGFVLSLEDICQLSEEMLNSAEMTHGECCAYNQQEPERMQVTREMAMDAQDMSLEGEWI